MQISSISIGDQNHREKSCYVASEFIAPSLLVGICKNLIFITVDIFKHTAEKIRKLSKRSTDFKELSPCSVWYPLNKSLKISKR
jgi:hypothetical protein